MKQIYKVAVIPGDGIGPEVIAEGVKVLNMGFRKSGFPVSQVRNRGRKTKIHGCVADSKQSKTAGSMGTVAP